jgi:hypothetical protein
MTNKSVLATLCVGAFLTTGPLGCSRFKEPGLPAMGTATLALSATAASGDVYRLRSATFMVVGTETKSIASPTDPADTLSAITMQFLPGEYQITLETGWQMWRIPMSGSPIAVSATLISPATIPFTIVSRQDFEVGYQFDVAGNTLAPGTLTIGISVTEGGGVAGAPVVRSSGCDAAPPTTDAETFTQFDVMLPPGSVDSAFIARFPVDLGDNFNWTKRNYYLRLPTNYDPTKAYPVDLAGTICGEDETSGSSGDYTLPSGMTQDGPQPEAIQIGLSYVRSTAATPDCAEFADDFHDSPEPAYVKAVIADVEAKFCVDESKIFVNGYSAGALEAELAGCTNADQIRAYGVQIGGGLRLNRPPCEAHPVAAMFVVGLLDVGYPIGPLATPKNDTYGSAAERDELLVRNGCVPAGTQIVDTCAMDASIDPLALPCAAGIVDGDTYSNVPHAMWDPAFPKCQIYTGCPAKYPVVWCPLEVNHGNGPTPMGPDAGKIVESYRRDAMWKFFSTLPAP